MAPLDRRRSSLRALLPLLFLILLSSTASAASAVLGIDIGTEYIKAALVKPGIPLEIVLTKDSKRKEAAALAFKPSREQTSDSDARPERLYGGDALALAGRYPGDVYLNVKSLLGVDPTSPAVERFYGNFPALRLVSVVRNETSQAGTMGIKSALLGEDEPAFMIEELLAMELQNIKANAEAAAGKGSSITDVVLTIPPYYTAEERRALELAADLAGLRVIGLISDGLAVGLNYATSRTFPSVTDGAKPEYHLVYDMGAGSTTATVLRFQARTVKDVGKRTKTVQEVQVMAAKWQRMLGGDRWNAWIVEDLAKQLSENPKVKALEVTAENILGTGKVMARLWKEAERMRQVVSANNEAFATFESIISDDITFKYKLSRTRFEEIVAQSASRVKVPLDEALLAAGISVNELDSVILHGGAVRTPFVQKALEAAVGSGKIKTNVNADEAAVLGAAFKAAGLSPSFRVKDIRAEDTAQYDVRLHWTNDGRVRTQKLFTEKSPIGAEKQVPINVQEDFALEFRQKVGDQEVPVAEIKVLNLTASVAQLKDKHSCIPANITTKFNIRLNPSNGLPEVLSGAVTCETHTQKDGGVIDNVKGLFGFGSKKTEQEPLGSEDTPVDISESEVTSSTTSTASTPASSSSTTTTQPAKPSHSIIAIPLSLSSRPVGLNVPLEESRLSKVFQRMGELDSSDRNRVLRAEALNTLEAFTYRARDYVTDDDFHSFSPAAIRATLEQKLSETSDWLYGDGVDAKLEDFKDRLKDLKSLVNPILKRKDESSKREGALKSLDDGIGQMKGMIEMVSSSVKKAEEDAKIAAAEAERLAAEVVETAKASSTESSESENLEEDPYSSSSSTSSTSSLPPLPSAILSPYTPADITTLQSAYDAAELWLKTKLAAQSKLKAHEDPILLVKEIEEQARKLQNVVRDTVSRGIRMPEMPKKAKPKSKPKAKPKKTTTTKKGKGKAGEESKTEAGKDQDKDKGSTTTTPEKETSSSSSSSTKASSHVVDEL